jgi:cytochrome c
MKLKTSAAPTALHSILVGATLLAVSIDTSADAAKGADVFDGSCAECHSVSSSIKNKKGPSLYGVVGRAAGQVPGFDYSDGLKASGLSWTPDKISAYVEHPKAVIPSGKMKFDGLSDPKERADLIDFLTTAK